MPNATEENLTDLALERWQACHSPRFREIMQSLITHLHGFVREIEPTQEEWLFAVNWLASTGQLSTDKRQEFILLSDVLGVSMLVDSINHRLPGEATPSTVQGPFHIEGSPEMAMGSDMAAGVEGEACYISGVVRDLEGRPIQGAKLDVWQADPEGLYESQIGSEEPRLRAIFRTGPDGKYNIRTVTPHGYSIPMDGTVGDMLKQTDISHFRPTHIHFQVSAPGYQSLTTHVFQKGAPYLDSDVVFGVKDRLITEFRREPAGKTPMGEIAAKPFWTVHYDFILSRRTA